MLHLNIKQMQTFLITPGECGAKGMRGNNKEGKLLINFFSAPACASQYEKRGGCDRRRVGLNKLSMCVHR
jgi:hypothetical protein